MMPDWGDAGKFVAGIVATLVAVWVARINRSATLAETLRRQEESIRKYLRDELKGRDAEAAALKRHIEGRDAETASLKKRVQSLERAHSSIRSLFRKALDQLALGLPADEHFAAILKALDEVDA